jgi:hypothetical protein
LKKKKTYFNEFIRSKVLSHTFVDAVAILVPLISKLIAASGPS